MRGVLFPIGLMLLTGAVVSGCASSKQASEYTDPPVSTQTQAQRSCACGAATTAQVGSPTGFTARQERPCACAFQNSGNAAYRVETSEVPGLGRPSAYAYLMRPSKLADLVVVIKGLRTLYLYRNGMPIREYRIALGGEPEGDKHRQGDQRTPVGAYVLDWRNWNSHYYKSIHVSYPNAQDLRYASRASMDPGGMIMIHGQPNYARGTPTGDWTDGCIAVSNEAMDEIWRLVPMGTPIHIYP